MTVETENNGVTAMVRKIFQMQGDQLNDAGQNIIVSHFGSFSQDLVSSLSEGLEDLLVSIGDKKIVIKRMFSILIEGLQNIRLHGQYDNQNRQLAYLLISNTKTSYKITMANIVKTEDVGAIIAFIDRINNFSQENLKETYLSVLSNEFLTQKGGAGLGFITTRTKSGNSLLYDFHELTDEKRLFALEITLNR